MTTMKREPQLRFPGFKDDWVEKKLGELDVVLVRGPFGSSLKKELMVPKGENTFKIYEQKHAIQKNIQLGEYYITEEKYRELKRFAVKTGDYIMSCSGTIGELFKIPVDFEPGIINQALLKISIIAGLDENFFCYAFKNAIYSIETKGSGIKNITSITYLKDEVLFSIPSIQEQKKIADCLTAMDESIESQQQKVEQLKAYKKGLLQQIFSQSLRFPGFEGEWEEKKLGELSNIIAGKKKENTGSEFTIMDMGSVSSQGTILAHKKTDEGIDMLNRGDLVMPKDDIGGGFIIGRTAYIDKNDKYVLGDHVYRIRLNEAESLFVHYQINTFDVNKELRRKATGTAQLGLNMKSVIEQSLFMPNLLEQQKIADCLSVLDELIELESQKLEQLRQYKKGLLQQLFV